ncbi:MAG: cupin domain-containing protein [Akkermansiaceae bacterium]|nr:cupin domain-containing protein [Akkermansiaceae bacterium]
MLITTLNDLPLESVSHNPDIKKKVFVRNGELGPITQFARHVFQPGDVAPGHSHQDMGEIFYVLSGTLTLAVDGTISTHRSGTSIALLPNEDHELSNQTDENLVLLTIGARMEPNS